MRDACWDGIKLWSAEASDLLSFPFIRVALTQCQGSPGKREKKAGNYLAFVLADSEGPSSGSREQKFERRLIFAWIKLLYLNPKLIQKFISVMVDCLSD